ncbi:MAG: caspase domain-containing protein [Saprospiraceae bacterium]
MKKILFTTILMSVMTFVNAQVITGETSFKYVDLSGDAPTPQPTNLNLVWLKPNPDEGQTKTVEKPTYELKIKAFGNNNLSKSDFSIYINNNKSYAKNGEVSLTGTTYTAKVTLNEGNNRIYVQCKGKKSKTITLYYAPLKPTLYVLSIGTNPPDLNYTQKDAQDFANLYETQAGFGNQLFEKVVVKRLIGKDAKANTITKSLEDLNIKGQTGYINTRDIVMVYISTHGLVYRDELYLQGDDYETGKVRSTAVRYKDVTDILSEIPCKKLVFLDACHSGAAAKADLNRILSEVKKLNRTAAGFTTIVSSSKDESSYEHNAWQNGAFTEVLLKGLKNGYADSNNDDIITTNELFAYLEKNVPQIVSQKINGKTQTPQLISEDLGDVGIYIVR